MWIVDKGKYEIECLETNPTYLNERYNIPYCYHVMSKLQYSQYVVTLLLQYYTTAQWSETKHTHKCFQQSDCLQILIQLRAWVGRMVNSTISYQAQVFAHGLMHSQW